MTGSSSSASSGLRGFATFLICRYRISSGNTIATPAYWYRGGGNTSVSKFGYGMGSSIHQGLRIPSGSDSVVVNKKPEIKTGQEDSVNVQPSNPGAPISRSSIFSWTKWLLGSILPLLFYSWKQKWDNMLKIEGKVEEIVEEAEEVAEVVEKVASRAEKLSEKVAEKLDDGKLKEAALMVEHVSSVTAKDAKLTQDFIHKVGDLKQDLEDLETMVEPVIDGRN